MAYGLSLAEYERITKAKTEGTCLICEADLEHNIEDPTFRDLLCINCERLSVVDQPALLWKAAILLGNEEISDGEVVDAEEAIVQEMNSLRGQLCSIIESAGMPFRQERALVNMVKNRTYQIERQIIEIIGELDPLSEARFIISTRGRVTPAKRI